MVSRTCRASCVRIRAVSKIVGRTTAPTYVFPQLGPCDWITSTEKSRRRASAHFGSTAGKDQGHRQRYTFAADERLSKEMDVDPMDFNIRLCNVRSFPTSTLQ